MQNTIFSGKTSRTKIITLITVIAILLVFVLNLLLTHFGREAQLLVDLTPEGIYSLTGKMVEYCADILDGEEDDGSKRDINVKILFCADPDMLIGSSVLRPTYFMALQLRNRFGNAITVDTVNAEANPALVAQYLTASRQEIYPTDMIVSYGGRYMIADISTFWTENAFSYNGEYRMASILASITAKDAPKVYFTSNHGEDYFDVNNPDSETSKKYSALYELVTERGLEMATIDLTDPEILEVPDDCALLIINNPKSDFVYDEGSLDSFFYRSELEKIDRFLSSHSGAIIVNKAYDVRLPVLEDYLKEWGIVFGEGIVKDKTNAPAGLDENDAALWGVYDIDSVGGAYYYEYAELASSPRMLFTNTGYVEGFYSDSMITESGGHNTQRIYSSFIGTTDKAVAYENKTSTVSTAGEGVKALAAMTTRTNLNTETSETTYSYVFASNSEDFLSNDILSNSSYANYNVLATLVSNISRTDRYASIDLGGTSLNSPSYGGKQTVSTTLNKTDTDVYDPATRQPIKTNYAFGTTQQVIFTIVAAALPTLALVFGLVVFIKRRNL